MIAIADRAKEQVKKVEEVKHEIEVAAMKVPTSVFFGVGLALCGAATGLALAGKPKAAAILATWAPTAMSIAIYMKLKQHDQHLQEHAGHSIA